MTDQAAILSADAASARRPSWLEPLWVARTVSADVRSFAELAYVCALAHVNRRKSWLRRRILCDLLGLFLASARGAPLTVKIRCRGCVLDVMFPNGAETEFWSISSTLYEVLINEVYRPRTLSDAKVVVDAGANFGLASLYLSTFFPTAEFICFEPSSETYPVLVRNLERNALRFRALHKAVSDADGEAEFETGKSSMERALVAPQSTGVTEQETETVRVVALRDELDRLGIARVDFLKFDVEGAEVGLLDGLGARLLDVGEVVGETHGPEFADAVRLRLLAAGFTVSEVACHIVAVRS